MPKCVRDVRAFFGLASYYRKFVQNFASIAEPLSALTKRGVGFSWSPKAQKAFERLKRALAETVTLAYPQPDQTFILDTDASDVYKRQGPRKDQHFVPVGASTISNVFPLGCRMPRHLLWPDAQGTEGPPVAYLPLLSR